MGFFLREFEDDSEETCEKCKQPFEADKNKCEDCYNYTVCENYRCHFCSHCREYKEDHV